ncbi:MAG: hypothetical protein WAN03_07725 [Candidatus Sulfotelmatobacter sp.]
MNAAEFVLLALGGSICTLNFYLSYIRSLLFRLAGRQAEFRFISGLPIVGSLAVIVYPWLVFAFHVGRGLQG